ncbi:MAG: hypothetical protein ACP5XB_14080, partial [Isosphaeraceae bacterium]
MKQPGNSLRSLAFSWAIIILSSSIAAEVACAQATKPHEAASPARAVDPDQSLERTSFQTGARWDSGLQLPADVAMCYGVGRGLAPRIKTWKEHGYITHLMTGVAWGSYQDYLYGRFDGKRHVDEAQTDRQGKVISHGGDVYYMCPGPTFGDFLAQRVLAAIEAGAASVHLEEPEFWTRGGYSAGFQRAWRTAYGEDWTAPHSSLDAQYKSSKLKYALYRQALKQVFDAVKADNAKNGRQTRCYVATHSLVNYAHWGIVSPESSLLAVGADGYIAQVWTGTARTPNEYEGVLRERTLETAFLEYGSMVAATRGSQGRLWFLHDPVEDNPDHSWEDYRVNWECTVVASLLWPDVARYEVAPWPDRVFHGRYPTVDRTKRKPGEPVRKEPIPQPYATELVTVMNALNDMNQTEVKWHCGTRGIGVVVSDSMMFQRSEPNPSDPHLGSFFGLALPLVERGMPVEPVQLETAAAATGSLNRYKIVIMTYEGMKPMDAQANQTIADWVKAGGTLIFVDDDRDPYNAVKSWWNQNGSTARSPREALFTLMGLDRGVKAGDYKVGKGTLIFDTSSPAALSYRKDGAKKVRELVRRASSAAGLAYRETNYLALRRGPYVIGVGLDDTKAGEPVHELKGPFIDLFDAHLAIVHSVRLTPGRKALLYRLAGGRDTYPRVLASACKTLGAAKQVDGSFAFLARGPEKTEASLRVGLPEAPHQVTVDGQPLAAASWKWDVANHVVLLRFPNSAKGCKVE